MSADIDDSPPYQRNALDFAFGLKRLLPVLGATCRRHAICEAVLAQLKDTSTTHCVHQRPAYSSFEPNSVTFQCISRDKGNEPAGLNLRSDGVFLQVMGRAVSQISASFSGAHTHVNDRIAEVNGSLELDC